MKEMAIQLNILNTSVEVCPWNHHHSPRDYETDDPRARLPRTMLVVKALRKQTHVDPLLAVELLKWTTFALGLLLKLLCSRVYLN